MYTVYKIQKDNNILYIGKTNNFIRRKAEHIYKRKLDNTYEFIVINSNLTNEEAKIQEEILIKEFNTTNNGWNISTGEGSKGMISNKGRFTIGNSFHKFRKVKKVLHVETNIEYESVKLCAEALNFHPCKISNVCNDNRKSYKKNHFKYI